MEKLNEIVPIGQKEIEDLIYTIRGQKVMLDSDLAKIYGYETKRLNEQVKRNIIKFPGDMMFQLSDDETEGVFKVAKCDLERKNHRGNNIKYNPYVFTEQGIYMLMTVLKGELAINQSIALVRAFKQMKDYLSDSKLLISSDEYVRLASITAQNSVELAKIKSEMVTKPELDKFIKSFNDKRIPKDYVLLNGQIVEAALAYSEIYSKAKKTIYIVDNYIGMKSLHLLKATKPGVNVIIFSDNIGNMLSLSDYNDYMSEYGYPTISFRQTAGKIHDRYIFLDYNSKSEKVYHCGASSKDAGKRTTSISLAYDNIYYHNLVDMLLQNPALVLK